LKLPDEFKILNTKIVIKPPYNDDISWNALGFKGNKFSILDADYKEREKALFTYFGLEFVEIQQPEVRELVHRLAIKHGFKGFDIRPFSSDNEWNGKKGVILFLRMHIERLKLQQANKRHDFRTCAGNIANQNYPGYSQNPDSIYSRFQDAQKDNLDIPNIDKLKEAGDYTIETLEYLLNLELSTL